MNESLSKRAEVGISIAILAYAGAVIATILTFGLEEIASLALLLLVCFGNRKEVVETRDLFRNLGTKGKLILILGAVASVGFIIAALVAFVRHLRWPAMYLYAGVMMWLVVTIALRKVAERNRAQ